MFGTDLSDQYLSYYHILRRSLKWTRKLAFHLFNLAVVNAFILWKKDQIRRKDMLLKHQKIHNDSHYRFRYRLAQELLAKAAAYGAPIPRARTNASAQDSPARLLESGSHFPMDNPATGKRQKGSRKCHVCTRSGISKNTSYMCTKCKVPLCVVPCFELFHTRDLYTRPKSAVELFSRKRKKRKSQKKDAFAER